MSPFNTLVPPVRSPTGTDVQSEWVHRRKNPVVVTAPLRGVCCCQCRSLSFTQPLGTGQPHVLTTSFFLLLHGAFLDFSVVVWLVPLGLR